MADKTYDQFNRSATDVSEQYYPVKLKDNSDGTYSIAMALTGSNVTGQAQTLIVDATVGGKPLPNIPADATKAVISAEGGDMRVFWDGTAPTAAAGHLVMFGDSIPLMTRSDLLAFRAIRTTATDGTLTVTYYKN